MPARNCDAPSDLLRSGYVQALAALVALGAALRFSTLGVQSYWLDEATTVLLLKHGFGDMLSRISGSESTPPLYYSIAWGWSRVCGTGEVGLRSLSAVFGTAFIPVAYAAGRELVSRRAGIALAALVAFNPLLVWYSQEARSYALLTLLGGLSFMLCARAVRRPSGRTLASWAVVSASALATHYFAFFLIVPEATWLLVTWRDRREVAAALGGVLAVAAALLPLALHQRGLDLASFINTVPLATRVAQVPKQFLIGYGGPYEVPLEALAAALALVGLLLAYMRLGGRDRAGARAGLVIGGATVLIPLILVAVGLDYFDTRNLLAAWLPLLLVPAAGFATRHAGRAGVVAATALCGIGLYISIAVAADPAFQRDNNRGLANALGAPTAARALVVTPASAAVPLSIYLRHFTRVPPAGGIQEIDLVALPLRSGSSQGSATPPRPANHPPPVPGFTISDQRFSATYTMIRFRSDRPITVAPSALYANQLDSRPATVLYQP